MVGVSGVAVFTIQIATGQANKNAGQAGIT